MDAKKGYYILGHVIVWVFAALCLMDIFRADVILSKFDPEKLPAYSIYKDKAIFIAYNVWGIIVAGLCSYSLWKKQRLLFFVSLLLLMVLMFYPWYSSN